MLRASDKKLHLGLNLPQPDLLHRRATARWYREYMMTLSPAAYWPMDDLSGLPIDVSGNSRDFTGVNGSPTYSEVGPFANPSVGYPSAAYHERAVFNTQTNDMAVCFWVYRNGATTSGGDLFTHGHTSGGFAVEYSSTAGAVRGNCPGVGTIGSLGTLADQTWTFVMCGKSTASGGIWFAGFNGAYTNIGTANTGTPVGNDRVNGQAATSTRFAHVAFFARQLTPVEVSTLYQIGAKVVIPR